jgi:hypothetical protein
MDPETMRAKVLAGLDRILQAPWVVQAFETADDKRMLHAARDFWQNATTEQLVAFIACYLKEPA